MEPQRSKWNVFSYYRISSLTIECVLLLCDVFSDYKVFSCYRMCSLTIECVPSQTPLDASRHASSPHRDTRPLTANSPTTSRSRRG